jgi:hypothetical protein
MQQEAQLNWIPADQAWRIFAGWHASRKEIGALFVSQSGTTFTLGILKSAKNGTVRLEGEWATSTFRLHDARFIFGPMQTWPRWPNPPIVEIIALQAVIPNGTWIVMADGLRANSISPAMLPEPPH